VKAERDRVVVGMSGGVDSSMAAALLKERGHHVVGVHLELPVFGEPDQRAARREVRRVSRHLDIPVRFVDAEDEFEREVLAHFADTYAAGRTPNPCVRCNARVKFRSLLAEADRLGARRVATGHYAGKENRDDGRCVLTGGGANDQAYFLYALSQEQLRRAAFPLAGLEKGEVRRMARERRLPVHGRPDSQDLCFLADGRYRAFLRRRCPGAFRPGPVVHVSGEPLGRHRGIGAYTVGQRRGMGIAHTEPLYVVAIRPEENTVVVGEREHLLKRAMTVSDVRWQGVNAPSEPLSAVVKIRYNHPGGRASISPVDQGRVRVEFGEPQEAPCPGQSAVFFDQGVLLGGGVIQDVIGE
jgi:tRNA-specific 2-thiouridylase